MASLVRPPQPAMCCALHKRYTACGSLGQAASSSASQYRYGLINATFCRARLGAAISHEGEHSQPWAVHPKHATRICRWQPRSARLLTRSQGLAGPSWGRQQAAQGQRFQPWAVHLGVPGLHAAQHRLAARLRQQQFFIQVEVQLTCRDKLGAATSRARSTRPATGCASGSAWPARGATSAGCPPATTMIQPYA